ncbi:MAG TPA: protein translocase subunit SecF [Chloroflexota bacterium]|nr:protein translocase subunit SecF [Chloroflexota bacterium]
MIDVLKYRYVYFLISALIILPGLVFIGLGGLKPGIDFTGGTELTVLMPKGVHPSISAVESVVRSVPYPGHPGYLDDSQVQQVQVQGQANQQGYLIRTRDIGANVAVQKSLIAALKAKYGNVQTQGFQSVGGTIGAQTTTRAIQAVIVAAIAILLYMAFAFRKLTHPFVYGGAAIVALLHDVLVVLGLFAIMGYFFNVRVDSLFVPAVLTVIGFSVHDTIVVFDRIRENMSRRTGEPYYTVVNNSLLQTLGRSLNTSLTVLLTLAALLLFGGSSIRVFVLALLIGITSGTYSSIFNATPLAVIWETGELPRLFGRGKKPESGRARTASARRPVGTLR